MYFVSNNDVNWIKLRLEYETTQISLRKLADKYEISFNTIKARAGKSREAWTKGRKAISEKVATKVYKKAVNNKVDRMVNEILAAELISKISLEALQDPKQFKRHLVNIKEKSYDSDTRCSDERQWVEEREFDVVDTKRLKELAGAVQTSTAIQRLIKGLMTENERLKLELDRERLELEKTRKKDPDITDDDEQRGVVILPSQDQSLMPKAGDGE